MGHTTAPSRGRLRVIVADDEPDALARACAVLRDAGITVVAGARDGREALELARHYAPDVVLMDVVMPVMDGIEATRRITAEVPATRVVMLTRSDDDELGLLGLRAGAVGHLSKLAGLATVVEAVRAAERGEAAISGRLSLRLVERLRAADDEQLGVRPVSSPLTPREWEVLDLLCADQRTAEIAERLVLSAETVRSHVRNILRKLGVRSRAAAVARATELRSPRSPAQGLTPGRTPDPAA